MDFQLITKQTPEPLTGCTLQMSLVYKHGQPMG